MHVTTIVTFEWSVVFGRRYNGDTHSRIWYKFLVPDSWTCVTPIMSALTYVRRRQGKWCRCCRTRWSPDTWKSRCRPAERRVHSASSRQHARGTGPSRDESYLRPCTTWPAPADLLWPDTEVGGGRPVWQGADERSATSLGAVALSAQMTINNGESIEQFVSHIPPFYTRSPDCV